MAARTLSGGAWRSPAHQLLADAVGLDPRPDSSATRRLIESQVNVFRDEPRGLLLAYDSTLSPDPELRAIGVRRLLSLLRRLAVRHGSTYVFEPNSPSFRRRVKRQFERILGDLLVRGALAGGRPDRAFRVVADDSVNPPSTVDLGRFVVELRVAPAEPLAFLRVLLIQGPDGAFLTREV